MKELVAYLTFQGNAREAMGFYAKALGGKLEVMTFGEAHVPGVPAGAENGVMHARLLNGPVKLYASDTMPGMPFTAGDNVSIAMACESMAEVERAFKALSERGQVAMGLSEAPWAERFGMLTDRFGVLDVDVSGEGEGPDGGEIAALAL